MNTENAQQLHLTCNTSQQAKLESDKALQSVTDFIITTLKQIDKSAFDKVTAIKQGNLYDRCWAIHSAIEQAHPSAANMLLNAIHTAELLNEACSSARRTLDDFEHACAMKAKILGSK